MLQADRPPLAVKTVRFASGERCPAVIDANGLLTFVVNDYGMVVLRPRGGSSSTMEAHLRAIVQAMNWAAERGIDLKGRFDSLELLSSFEVEDLRDFMRLRKRVAPTRGRESAGSPVVSSGTLYNRCHFVRDYLVWRASLSIQRIRTDDPKLPEARKRLEWFGQALVANLPRPRSAEKEGLSEAAQEFFLDVISPESPRNPFKRELRIRNHALLLLYYETGMRRGELLKIKGEHLHLNGDRPIVNIRRDPDDPKDPRGVEPKVKTQSHDDPLSPVLVAALRAWLIQRSRLYPTAKRTPYVFVSRTGRPMGVRTVGDMFELLAARFPELAGFHAHILRYTGNERFSAGAAELGLNEDLTRQARNQKFGWTKNSKQGEHYDKAHARKNAERVMLKLQEKSVKGLNR